MQLRTHRQHIAGLLMVLATACFDNRPACVPGVKHGERFAVTLHERWDNTSASNPANIVGISLSPCAMSDLAPGTRAVVELGDQEFHLNECVLPSCSDDFLGTSEPLTGSPPVSGGGAGVLCMNRHRKVRLGDDCEVARVVELRRYDAASTDLTDPPRPGQQPHVVLVRRLEFVTGKNSALCSEPSRYFPPSAKLSGSSWSCADVFAVSLEKQ